MSRSRRKSSSRRRRSEAEARIAPSDVAPLQMEAEATSGPKRQSVAAPLPSAGRPHPAEQGGQVSRTVCLLCCLVCLLAGVLVGNLLPHMTERAGSRAASPVATHADAPSEAAPVAAADAGSTAMVPPEAPGSRTGATGNRANGDMDEAAASLSPEQRHIAHLEQALQQQPNDAARWTELGNAYFDTRQPLKAIVAYERSLRLQPDNPDVWTDLGIMYRESGQYEKALECFDTAINRKHDHEPALFNKGVVLLFDLHRHADARAAWQRLLGINPGATAPDGTSLRDLIRKCDKPLP